ncbi:MAG TPA: nucleotide pyrophosphohydrolase [Candidatus Nanopelagicaceae bacterium]|nr:nucleotide pyrophosphohydrolase [Candidatus Nanopelagicaceae bacterium]
MSWWEIVFPDGSPAGRVLTFVSIATDAGVVAQLGLNRWNMGMTILQELKSETRAFAEARNWPQFHTPKNLAMAVAGEAGELLAEFQWLTPAQSDLRSLTEEQLRLVRLEMADIFIYLIRLADVLEVDLASAAREKLAINEERFPLA